MANASHLFCKLQNIIYFTIQAPDVQGEPELKIEPKKITFSAKAGECV
jgi:hypothetical protein